jgi:SAM-dependent methyltransferase
MTSSTTHHDARRFAPAFTRNREPILRVLQPRLPASGLVLEIGSGTGEHITHIAQASPPCLVFQPSDPDEHSLASIDAWVSTLNLGNVRTALRIDATKTTWPLKSADAVLCINMIHIAPWAAAVGMVRGAAHLLPHGGLLYLYGPFRREGRHTSPSNAAFDDNLCSRNSAWGVRDLEAVAALAASHGFRSPLIEDMPANNLSVMFTRG